MSLLGPMDPRGEIPFSVQSAGREQLIGQPTNPSTLCYYNVAMRKTLGTRVRAPAPRTLHKSVQQTSNEIITGDFPHHV